MTNLIDQISIGKPKGFLNHLTMDNSFEKSKYGHFRSSPHPLLKLIILSLEPNLDM